MPAKLRLDTTWNRDPLPATDQASLAYLVVDISGTGDRGSGIGDRVQSPTKGPDPRSPVPDPRSPVPGPQRLVARTSCPRAGLPGRRLSPRCCEARWPCRT